MVYLLPFVYIYIYIYINWIGLDAIFLLLLLLLYDFITLIGRGREIKNNMYPLTTYVYSVLQTPPSYLYCTYIHMTYGLLHKKEQIRTEVQTSDSFCMIRERGRNCKRIALLHHSPYIHTRTREKQSIKYTHFILLLLARIKRLLVTLSFFLFNYE